MSVAIVDYGSGNLHSAAKAFERAARESGYDQPIVVTRDPDAVRKADRVVLPGVGAFADCRRGLDAVPGMVAALEETVRGKGRPFLGICVGMQLMAERGREYQVTDGLGWIAGEVDKIAPRDPALKIPHMGWNTLKARMPHKLLDGIPLGPDGLHAYFVHSYQLTAGGSAPTSLAEADYGGPVTAMVARDSVAGTQFHPEKSQKLGLALDRQFPELEAVRWLNGLGRRDWRPDLWTIESANGRPSEHAVILFPAIDLKDGLCVRLQQGDMARATVFNRDPAAQAHAFETQGFRHLHVVDLDGAFAGKPMNVAAVERILETVGLCVQLGGGIRDMKTIEGWLAKGVNRVIIGTAAVRDPALVKEAAKKFPKRVAVGLDANDGKVAVEGWAETSELTALDIAKRFEDAGVAAIIYTDVARDGMLQGHQLGRHHRARRSDLDSGDRLGRTRFDRRHQDHDRSRAPRSSKAPSPAARSMTGGSTPAEALKMIRAARDK